MACGQCFSAVRNGMAECTPNFRASYDAAATTPRSPRCPPTTTALPFNDGLNNSSTETKNASMSTWKIVLAAAFISQKCGHVLNSDRRNGMQLPGAFKHPHIFLGGNIPGEILGHAIAHQHLPRRLIAEGAQRVFNGRKQEFSVVFGELKASSFARPRIPWINRVIQAAGGPHNRHRSIFQAVNLVQSEGLIARRHQ